MSIKRSHLQSSPLCLIYFHMTSVCRYQTPRIESCCAYGGRGGRFDPPFLFGWALLVHRIDILRSDATIFTCTLCSNSFVLRMPVSTRRLCLGSQFRIFPSFKQRTFSSFLSKFFLCNEVNCGSSIVCSKCHGVPTDRYPLRSSIMISASTTYCIFKLPRCAKFMAHSCDIQCSSLGTGKSPWQERAKRAGLSVPM
jgi:hypothetical protein